MAESPPSWIGLTPVLRRSSASWHIFPWEKVESWPEEAVACYARTLGYQPDIALVYLSFLANAIGDIGELVQAGAKLSRPDVQHVVDAVEFWAEKSSSTMARSS